MTEISPAPWTWINRDSETVLAWVEMALAAPNCNAIIISRNHADGALVNMLLRADDVRQSVVAALEEAHDAL